MRVRSELDELCEEIGVRCTAALSKGPAPEGWIAGTKTYKCALHLAERTLKVSFYCGPGLKEPPSAADVLSCRCSDALAGEMSFKDFCDEFGLDDDSRAAERTWRACRRIGPTLRAFLGEHFDAATRAQH